MGVIPVPDKLNMRSCRFCPGGNTEMDEDEDTWGFMGLNGIESLKRVGVLNIEQWLNYKYQEFTCLTSNMDIEQLVLYWIKASNPGFSLSEMWVESLNTCRIGILVAEATTTARTEVF